MYTNDQKIHAIEIVKKCKGIINKAWRLLGYPDSRDTLKLWYKNFQEDNNKITKTPRYSDKEIDKAVSYYLECKNIQKTIDDLKGQVSKLKKTLEKQANRGFLDRLSNKKVSLDDD